MAKNTGLNLKYITTEQSHERIVLKAFSNAMVFATKPVIYRLHVFWPLARLVLSYTGCRSAFNTTTMPDRANPHSAIEIQRWLHLVISQLALLLSTTAPFWASVASGATQIQHWWAWTATSQGLPGTKLVHSKCLIAIDPLACNRNS